MEKMPGQTCRTSHQRKERTITCVYFGALQWWWCLAMLPCLAAYQPELMFLNSLAHCGHGDSRPPWHKVDHRSLYNIKDDLSPETKTSTFLKDCHMVFRSTRIDGRLCLFQRSLEFVNNNVELLLYDGRMGEEGKSDPDMVVSMDVDLPNVEWCSSGRFLTIQMVARSPGASVEDVVIDLLIYHMSSLHRKAFMDTSPSCGSKLKLDHSRVNVSNKDTSMAVSEIHGRCSLEFEYQGQENRSICMVFEPYMPCTLNYTLQVFEFVAMEGNPRKSEVLSHEGGCDRPLPKKWCSNSTKIKLALHRVSVNKPEDILFHALILDHQGDPKTLPSLFADPEDHPAEKFTHTIVGITVGSVCFVVIAIIAVIFWKRRRHPKTTQRKDNSDCSNHMLPGREKTARNGGNIYTGASEHV